MKTEPMLYQTLELIPEPKLQSRSLLNWLSHRWKDLLNSSIACTEPCIWKKTTTAKDQRWCVYDPQSGETNHLSSEAEVREWLERRYYR